MAKRVTAVAILGSGKRVWVEVLHRGWLPQFLVCRVGENLLMIHEQRIENIKASEILKAEAGHVG